MEDKNLTSAESLALIEKMIANTRHNFSRGGGTMFLIWGYTTLVVTAAIVLTAMLRGFVSGWAWLAVPVIGGLLSWLHLRKNRPAVTTHLDKSVSAVWTVFVSAVMCCMVAFYIQKMLTGHSVIDMPFIVSLLLSMATVITGKLINYRPVMFSGMIGMGITMGFPAFSGDLRQLICFAVICFLGIVLPGHLLNAAARRESKN